MTNAYYLFILYNEYKASSRENVVGSPEICMGVLIFVNRIRSISTANINNTKLKLLSK